MEERLKDQDWWHELMRDYGDWGTRLYIYVAGPYRGPTPWAVERNIRRAEEVTLEAVRAGQIPICPHTMYRYFDKTMPDQFWLDLTLRLLTKCDAIVMLPGWRGSEGSVKEHAYAIENGLGVYYVDPDDRKPQS